MKKLVVYTMKGCPYCEDFKKILKEQKIKFVNRDIDKHSDEYDLFVSITNEYVPSFMIVDEENPEKSEVFAPELHFSDLDEALKLIKNRI